MAKIKNPILLSNEPTLEELALAKEEVKKQISNEKFCYNKEISTSQMYNELRIFGNIKGCMGFIKTGCPSCNGYKDKKTCSHYESDYDLKIEHFM